MHVTLLVGATTPAGNLGGITRDLLIGMPPRASISDWRYLGVSVVAGGITFWWSGGTFPSRPSPTG